MKTRLFIVLFGLFSFLVSTAVLAHNPGYGHAYAGVPLITLRGNYYGHSGYAGNLRLGFAGGYSNHYYPNDRYYGHRSDYGYARAYYRHGHHNRHHGSHQNNHYGRHQSYDHHDRHH